MRSTSTKLTPPPPVPPRPSKTVVAEALAKTRRTSADGVKPIRSAPPPPEIKPKPQEIKLRSLDGVHKTHVPQVMKSFSSAMVFNPKLREEAKVVRSVSDCGDDIVSNKTRTVVYQSANVKTSKIEVNLVKKPSVKLKRVESTKNDKNKENGEEKQCIKVAQNESNYCVKINTKLVTENIPTNSTDKVINSDKVITDDKKEIISDTIVQSNDKTMIIVTNQTDDANNNIFQSSKPKTNSENSDQILPTMDLNHLSEQIDHNLSDSSKENSSKESTSERKNRKVMFDDKINHEILIAELQSMHEEQERLSKRQRVPPVDIYDVEDPISETPRIQHSDWVEVNNGEEVRLSSCQITIDSNDSTENEAQTQNRKLSRTPSMSSSLHGLPPLPKSLSGFNLLEGTRRSTPQTPIRAAGSRGPTPPSPAGHVVYPPHPRVNGTTDLPRGRKVTTLDTQLAILRREMYGLRQLDLSLLTQLYSLNESIQDFRAMLQDQEDSALSPHSPSPSPSSGDEGDEFYSPAPIRFRPAPPAPPLRRTSNSSSANSSEYGTV